MPWADKQKHAEYVSHYRKTEPGKAGAKRAYRKWFAKNREERNAYMRAWNAKNRDRVLPEQKAKYRRNPLYKLVYKAKGRALEKGLSFDIAPGDLIVPEVCPVLGIPIYIGDGRHSANSPTLDRIDNSKGYIKGNVMVISYRANSLKSDASLDELRAILRFYEGRL